MDDLTALSASPEASPPARGPGDELDITAGAAVGLAIASFLAVLTAFLVGQLIQLMNVPLGLTVTSLGIFGAAGFFFPALFNLRPGPFTGFSRSPGWYPALAVLIGALNLPLANFMMAVMAELLPASWSIDARETTKLLLNADQVSRVLIVFAAGIAAPVGEELFFRGWLQPLLARRVGTAMGVVSVAIAFSAVHLDPVGFVPRVELGILFGLARAWTGSLWPAIALHATHNLISTAALYFAPDPQAQIDLPLDLKTDGPVALVSLALTMSVLRAFYRMTRASPVEAPAAVVPPRFTWRPALRLAAINAAFLLISTTALATFRERLPGVELTRGAWERFMRGVRPPPPGPTESSGG